jgi:hypothetical protein
MNMLITDKYGHEYEYDGPTLPDGAKLKVSMLTADAAQKAVAARRTSAKVTDAFGGSAGLHRPGARLPAPRPARTTDHAVQVTLQKLAADAFDEAQRADANAWQQPAGAYPLSAGVGSSCTINGSPGTLVRDGEWLRCVPTQTLKSARADLGHDAKPPTAEDREAVLREVALRDEAAWMKGNV